MLLVVSTGLFVRLLDAADLGGSLGQRDPLRSCRDHARLRAPPGRATDADRNAQMADAVCVLLDLLYGFCWMAIVTHTIAK